MATIYIEKLTASTTIGVYNWERQIKQTVVVDATLEFDISKAAASDDIEHALDYATLAARLTSYIENSEFQLLETLASQLADIIQQEYSIEHLSLRISKPHAVANASNVGIEITR